MTETLHILRPSPARRIVGVSIQAALGGLLLWIAVARPPQELGWHLFLIVFGVAALVVAQKGWRGSAQPIVLDAAGLRQEDGTPIAPLAEIASVDRALFSFKPSNGFLVTLRTAPGGAWVPGMWWRLGRRVGIGGVTGGAETRILADALTAMVAERDARER